MLKHLRWSLLWALLILVLCLLPGKEIPQWHWADLINLDKPVHAGLFGVQALLLTIAFRAQTGNERLRIQAPRTALWVAIVYGLLTELMQGAFIVGRTADINDLFADALGGLIAYMWTKRRDRHGKPLLGWPFRRSAARSGVS